MKNCIETLKMEQQSSQSYILPLCLISDLA